MPDPARQPNPPALRKIQAMLGIQDIALGLFESDGYRKVSVVQVAAAAGVSESTIYRYFRTKERLVVWEYVDTQAITLLTAGVGVVAPAELLAEVKTAAPMIIATISRDGDDQRIRRRVALMASEPELRTGELLHVHNLEQHIRRLLALRLGREENDLTIRYAAAQAAWGYLAGIDHWAATEFAEPLADVLQRTTDLMVGAVGAVLSTAG